MKILNFFHENLKIAVDTDNLDNIMSEIEKKYKIPRSNQKLNIINNKVVLSIAESEPIDILHQVPEDIRVLGADEENYNRAIAYLQANNFPDDSESIKDFLFPYLYKKESKKYIFTEINKKDLQNTSNYVNKIPNNQQEIILKNLEDYIVGFLDTAPKENSDQETIY